MCGIVIVIHLSLNWRNDCGHFSFPLSVFSKQLSAGLHSVVAFRVDCFSMGKLRGLQDITDQSVLPFTLLLRYLQKASKRQIYFMVETVCNVDFTQFAMWITLHTSQITYVRRWQRPYQLNSTQLEITDAGVWHLYVRIINNITIL